MLLFCVDMEIDVLNKNIGRWETTWFNCHILYFKCFNLVGYDLYQYDAWQRGTSHQAIEFKTMAVATVYTGCLTTGVVPPSDDGVMGLLEGAWRLAV